jgi:hypothetical protein
MNPFDGFLELKTYHAKPEATTMKIWRMKDHKFLKRRKSLVFHVDLLNFLIIFLKKINFFNKT